MSRSRTVNLSNAELASVTALALLAGALLAIVAAALPGAWGLPGGPLLQAAAALGSLLLLASFAAAFAKRLGRPGKQGFRGHVWLAALGVGLVLPHALQGLDRPPALLLLMLAALIGLGVWSRTAGARLTASAFGEKPRGFEAIDPEARQSLKDIIEAKRDLLQRIDPSADEALFSPTMRHWLTSPFAAGRYARLAAAEERLTGARAALPPAQSAWRLLHRLIAWGFVAGLIGHIVIVMLFARYAADERAIYWLHFAAWDF